MHATNPLSISKRNRPRSRKGTSRAPTPDPFLHSTHLNPWTHSNECLTSSPHTRHRDWCQHPLKQSDRPSYRMQKLRVQSKLARQLRFHWCDSSKSMRQAEGARRCKCRAVPAGPILCCSREEPIHRPASSEAARGTR